jgi:putative ABC transport system permease protein
VPVFVAVVPLLERQERATLRAALLPTINGLLTVGRVALPGMMTGQIVSGTAPEQAVRYQIVILNLLRWQRWPDWSR